MFQLEDNGTTVDIRTHILETLLLVGHPKRIIIDLTNTSCSHSVKPSHIFWKDLPILKLTCLGTECDITIQNNTQNVLSFLLKHVIIDSLVSHFSILIDLKLPTWDQFYEFVFVINKEGFISTIPTSRPLSPVHLSKLVKYINIQTDRKSIKKDDSDLMDILVPNDLLLRDFKIRM
jgi:hypothetical protein